jgi:hypothetical protein
MRTIKIVFTKSKKTLPIFSWLVRLWTWKPYSHVARNKVILGESMFYQASEGKVNYENWKVFSKKHYIVKTYYLHVPDEIELKMSIACLKEAGKSYAMLQNMGIVIVDVLGVLGIRATNPFKKGRNCSELLYLNVLKPLCPDLDYRPDLIKPHHIEEILVNKLGLTEA